MTGSGTERARRAASELIRKGHYTTPIDVVQIARDLNVPIRFQALEESVSGMLVVREGHPVIGVNEAHHSHRQRFTIAHELGHWVLHRGLSDVFIDAVYYRDGDSAEGTKRQEIEANTFAAELLMPEPLVREQFGPQPIADIDDVAVRRLAARFGVSSQALTVRLTVLGLIAAQ